MDELTQATGESMQSTGAGGGASGVSTVGAIASADQALCDNTSRDNAGGMQ